MRCWKCDAQVAGSTCLNCGCVQSTRQEAKSEIGISLRYAYDKFGAGQILNDRVTLRRCLSDLIPDEKKLRQQIGLVMDTDVGQRLYALMRNNGDVDLAFYQSLAGNMRADCGLSAEQAQTVLDYLLEMIGLTNPRKTQTPPRFSQPETPPVTQTPPITQTPPAPPGPPEPADPGAFWAPVGSAAAVLVSQKNVLLEDATHGVDGWAKGKRGECCVRSDGVAYHQYHGMGTKKPSEYPDIFIPRHMIQRVTENFFLGTYAFTIVTVDGKRFRATVPGRKENAVSMIEAIRTLI